MTVRWELSTRVFLSIRERLPHATRVRRQQCHVPHGVLTASARTAWLLLRRKHEHHALLPAAVRTWVLLRCGRQISVSRGLVRRHQRTARRQMLGTMRAWVLLPVVSKPTERECNTVQVRQRDRVLPFGHGQHARDGSEWLLHHWSGRWHWRRAQYDSHSPADLSTGLLLSSRGCHSVSRGHVWQ